MASTLVYKRGAARARWGPLAVFVETPGTVWILYLTIYLAVGAFLQLTAPYTRIARFAHDWQVLTIYGCYLVPLSIFLRGRPWHRQYAYAVLAIAPVDLVGFTLGTSLAYDGNPIDRVLGVRNFTLGFVLTAAFIPLLGNLVVPRIAALLVRAGRRGPALYQ